MQNVTELKYTTVAVMGRSITMRRERNIGKILEIIDFSARV